MRRVGRAVGDRGKERHHVVSVAQPHRLQAVRGYGLVEANRIRGDQRDAPGEGGGPLQQLIGRHQLVHDADPESLSGIEVVAGERVAMGVLPSAEESEQEVKNILRESDMLFITCGLGGGTGTSGAPVIADIAKKLGVLTVAIVTLPFSMGTPSSATMFLLPSAAFLGPLKDPSELTTRWHGTIGQSGFL